ncbi:MAG: HAD-IA family hydrolase [Novosphingobium sp.]|nr:HAD-IA family hydrolase [Novosphingobium sp.]
MSEPLLVIFDMDGTLVDSQHLIVSALTSTLISEGVEVPSRKELLSVVGLSLVEAMRRLAHGEEAMHLRMADTYKEAFNALRVSPEYHEPLYPGTQETLEALSRRDEVLLGIATGKSMRGVDRVLDLHGLRPLFHNIQTADSHPSKPHPSMVLTALDETGIAANRAVVIGDTMFDMEMARSAGANAIGVSWGYHDTEHLAPAGAQAVIEDFAELDPVLAAMFAPEPETAK